MTYSFRTPRYRIPMPGFGQIVESFEERNKAQIIEQQLIGAVRQHGGHGIIARGNFAGVIDGGSGKVTLSTGGADYALEAFINNIYVNPINPVVWDSLPDATTSYLYVTLVEDNPISSNFRSSRQFGNVVPGSNTSGIIPADSILVAAAFVDVGGGTVAMNLSPAGIILVPRIDQHVATSGNPHGPLLEQNYMIVSGLSVLNTLAAENLFVGQNLLVSGPSYLDGQTVFSNSVLFNSTTFMSGRVFHQATVEYNSGTSYGAYRHAGTFRAQDANILNALVISGQMIVRNQIVLQSGATLNAISPLDLQQLADGSNADALHIHRRSYIDPQVFGRAPHYADGLILEGQTASGLIAFGQPLIGSYNANNVNDRPNLTYNIGQDGTLSPVEQLPVYVLSDPGGNSGRQASTILAHAPVPLDFKYFDTASGIQLWLGDVASGSAATHHIRVWDTRRYLVYDQLVTTPVDGHVSIFAGPPFAVAPIQINIASGVGVFMPGGIMTIEIQPEINSIGSAEYRFIGPYKIWYKV